MKFTVYGVDGYALGEFTAIATPGWTLGGTAVVTPGGSLRVSVPESVMENEWMQLGNLVVTRPHPDLDLWAGMIDTPWNATLPGSITIYGIDYLLKIRTPDNPFFATGNAEAIMRKMVELANSQQEMYLRIGNVSVPTAYREETIKQSNLFDQFQAFAVRSATEYLPRAVVERGRLMIYFDLAEQHGQNTNYLLFDGENGNMTITNAAVDGQIYNRVIGLGAQSTSTSRLQSAPYSDAGSAETYRLRSAVKQFDVTTLATLNVNTAIALEDSKFPFVKLDVKISNRQQVFRLLRCGNVFLTHASRLHLPGGQRGWKGWTRLYAMSYNEPDGSVSATLTGAI